MPTLDDLRTSCARDLRDTAKRTFTDPYLTDFINSGIEEVGRVYPRELILTTAIEAGEYAIALPDTQQIVRVEVWRDGAFLSPLDNGADGASSQAGWELWAGSLRLPKATLDSLRPATDTLAVWGYQGYPQLVDPTDESFLDASGEWGVRRYVRAIAFQQMQGDRALFKQWQSASQNTDVTVNQLTQLVAFYTDEWNRSRNHIRRLRRV